MALNAKEKKYLLELVRKTVTRYIENGEILELKPEDVPHKSLIENGACFVTLHIGKELKGCIGTLEAHRPLVFDVIDNALGAAFNDPRFYPLRREELTKVTFSMSVLSAPKPLPVKDEKDLLKKLVPHKHGLIIQMGVARATFLPVVWEQLPKKDEFLSHLCMKAGLLPDEWKRTKGIQFYTSEAEEFSE